MARFKRLDYGLLTIGMVSTAKYFVPQLLARFRANYPGVELRLRVTGSREQLVDLLRAGDIGLSVVGRPPKGVATRAEDTRVRSRTDLTSIGSYLRSQCVPARRIPIIAGVRISPAEHRTNKEFRMKKSLITAGATFGTLVLLAVAAPIAQAEERLCNSALGAITVDNLRVPGNAICSLVGTRVKGTIKVEYNAVLRARKIVVIGNVQAENAKLVNVLEGSRIGGSVQIKQGGGANVYDSFVDGDIQYESNRAVVRALRSGVGGSIQAFQNVGGVELRRNIIDGNLQCKSNKPVPVGGGNVVGGNKEDQCARL